MKLFEVLQVRQGGQVTHLCVFEEKVIETIQLHQGRQITHLFVVEMKLVEAPGVTDRSPVCCRDEDL